MTDVRATIRGIGTAVTWTIAAIIILAVVLTVTLIGIGIGLITKEQ